MIAEDYAFTYTTTFRSHLMLAEANRVALKGLS
jgi:hypothetical protein